MGVELTGERGQIGDGLCRHLLERGDMALHLAVGRPGLERDVVHRRDEIGHARDQRAFDLAHVLVRPAENLLQQDICLAQPLEQRGGIRAQHVLGLENLGDCGGGALLGLLDCGLRGLLKLAQGARDCLRGALGGHLGGLPELLDRTPDRLGCPLGCGGVAALQVLQRLIEGARRGIARLVDKARDLLAVVHHGLGEIEALGLYRLHCVLGHTSHLARELLALGGERGKEPARLVVENARHLRRTLAYRV